ncbi:hypothetical protein JR316_0003082 [Psilocybe cubensis]|uniref:Uncharacterized protein n=2 Tax=Psilocybe cubensis TaxID=181762 RepID=A0ACB8H7I6_PSICU|nr:hypothetical protein JR316_0003082 [Psilocybe cubensis]KAH9483612.1 hypothetical protein JR316_0003082 [Psilocybe cubensis]
MLLGREYYQTSFEPLLVLGPITIHAVSGVLKRILSPPGRPPRKLSNLLSLTGYGTMLLFLPIHFLTHRGYPMLETAPIYGVGPAELDYEFVKTGLKTWPIRSTILYGGLILSTTLHLVDGMTLIWNSWLKDSLSSKMASWKREARPKRILMALGCLALPVMTGLYTLFKEPMMTFTSMAKRYEAVYLTSLIYRL